MDWTRGPTIGRGSSAVVSLATTSAGHLFAVKSAEVSSSTSLRNEQCIISQLNSPFIIKCLGSDITCEKNKTLYNLHLEYVAGGTLSDLIKTRGGSLSKTAIRSYSRQILAGLNYLHAKGLVHCDVKGRNVLVGEHGLKIADFGCARRAGRGGVFAGTPAYMSPEAARGEEQGFAADVWALGCTVVEMATGANPWPEMVDPASALYRVGYSGDLPRIPDWFSDCGKDFVGRCLVRDGGERWTAAQLLGHPFFDSDCGDQIGGFTSKSPASVMDQGFWDALEPSDSDYSPNPTEIVSSEDSWSADGRIRGLIGEAFSGNLNFSDWTEDGEWITVRTSRNEDVIVGDYSVTFESVDEEEIQTSIGVEDLLSNSLSDESSVNDVSNLQVMFSDSCKDDFVSRVVTLMRLVMKIFSDSDQLFLLSLISLFLCFFPGVIRDGYFNLKMEYYSSFCSEPNICGCNVRNSFVSRSRKASICSKLCT